MIGEAAQRSVKLYLLYHHLPDDLHQTCLAMKNCFYCIPGISLALQTKSQTELQKSSTIRNFLNSLKLSSNTFHVCLSPDMLCLYQWILISDISFTSLRSLFPPHRYFKNNGRVQHLVLWCHLLCNFHLWEFTLKTEPKN